MTVILEISSKCNMRCYECYAYRRKDKVFTPGMTDMTVRDVENLVSKLDDKRILLSGGNPNLNPELHSIFDTVKDHGCSAFVLTPVAIDLPHFLTVRFGNGLDEFWTGGYGAGKPNKYTKKLLIYVGKHNIGFVDDILTKFKYYRKFFGIIIHDELTSDAETYKNLMRLARIDTTVEFENVNCNQLVVSKVKNKFRYRVCPMGSNFADTPDEARRIHVKHDICARLTPAIAVTGATVSESCCG